jgi:hypothetical protein
MRNFEIRFSLLKDKKNHIIASTYVGLTTAIISEYSTAYRIRFA